MYFAPPNPVLMKKISIKDIARQAGVSTTTVSFVLNGKSKENRISEPVSEKIQQLAIKLNYKPNHVARGLRTGQTKTIGLMVEDISNFFFANMAKAVEDEADKSGYKVLYCSTENSDQKAIGLLDMLRYRQVDGYIITPTKSMEKEIELLKKDNKPIVLIDRYFPAVPTNYVMIDNFRAAYEAIDHFIKMGYCHIGIVTTDSGQLQMQERMEGYMAALKDHKIPFNKRLVKKVSFDVPREKSVEEIREMLAGIKRPAAVFFTTNYLGIYGLESIKQLGLNIPEDIAVISFDDHDLFRLHTPGITAVSQPISEMGKQAVNILIRALNGEEQLQQLVLPAMLVKRESCANINSRETIIV